MTRHLLALALAVLAAGSTLAAAASPFTIHLSNVSETVFVNNPCVGPMVGELNYDAVIHVTESDDFYHAHINARGTSVSIPQDPDIAPFSGRFHENRMVHFNRDNSNQSIVVTQLGPGGRAFHITFHLTVTGSGATMFVQNVSCGA